MVRIWKISSNPFYPKDRSSANHRKYLEFSKKNNFIAIGWITGDLKGLDKSQILQEINKLNEKNSSQSAEQIYEFVNSINEGDIILHYLGSYTIYNVGIVKKTTDGSVYYFVKELEEKIDFPAHINKRITVSWWNKKDGQNTTFNVEKKPYTSITGQNTIKRVNNNDLDLIKDEELKEFLKKKIKDYPSKDTIAKIAKNVLEISKKPMGLTNIYDEIIKNKLYDFGALDHLSALRVALERRCNNVEREDSPKEKWFIRYDDHIYGLIGYVKLGLSKNLILYGPPGTGKTFITKRKAVEIIRGAQNG